MARLAIANVMRMHRFVSIFVLALAFSPSPALSATDRDGKELPLPRFASLKSGEVNLRTGPGASYPIDWVLTKATMPVEIIAEFETWRRVRDVQGTEGWVHQMLLSGKRTAVVIGEPREMRRKAETTASVVAILEPGVIVSLLECDGGWCRVDVQGRRGWLPRAAFWGVYEGEKVKN
jgi:SH3-like domain-containing protein